MDTEGYHTLPIQQDLALRQAGTRKGPLCTLCTSTVVRTRETKSLAQITSSVRNRHMPEETLSPRQQRFVEEYCIDFNGAAAARRAGYAKNTAESQASRLLALAKVAEAVEAEKERRGERIVVTKEWLTSELADGFREARQAKNFPGMGRIGELLARMHGYIPEPERRVRLIREVSDLTEDELLALAAADKSPLDDATRH